MIDFNDLKPGMGVEIDTKHPHIGWKKYIISDWEIPSISKDGRYKFSAKMDFPPEYGLQNILPMIVEKERIRAWKND
jgi:hypothetical protein